MTSKPRSMTRRAAIGATAALAVSTLPAMATASFREGRSTSAQLKVAFKHFRAAVMAIDPTITAAWSYTDHDTIDENGDAKLCGVMLERVGKPVIVRPNGRPYNG